MYICTTAAFNNPGITVGQGCLLTYTSEILTDFWFSVGPVRVQIVANTGECGFNALYSPQQRSKTASQMLPLASQGFQSEVRCWLKHIHAYIHTDLSLEHHNNKEK